MLSSDENMLKPVLPGLLVAMPLQSIYAIIPKYGQIFIHGIRHGIHIHYHYQHTKGWLGDAMVLGKLPVPWRPTIWITVGQGPTALAVGAVGVVWTFLLSSILSPPFLPHFGRGPDID